jgi:hypothetical protein
MSGVVRGHRARLQVLERRLRLLGVGILLLDRRVVVDRRSCRQETGIEEARLLLLRAGQQLDDLGRLLLLA